MRRRFSSRAGWLILLSTLAGTGLGSLAEVPGTILTVAGSAQEGFGGDGGRATAAQLRSPCCVTVDARGNLYINDAGNHRIRKVSPEGTISTVAGTGERGYSGDGGRAAEATLSSPGCMAVDSAGNLYFSDTDNHVVRMVSGEGNITTVAGTGKAGYGGDGGAATSALLSYPGDVAVDSAGNLFIADTANHRIRRVSGGNITTVAGTGKAGYGGDGGPAASALLSYPSRVAVDAQGNLFIADTGNSCIRKVNLSAGTITTLAGTGKLGYSGDGGSALAAQLNSPFGLAVDSTGNLFIADTGNSRIRKVNPEGNITTVAGTYARGYGGDQGPASAAQLDNPFGIAVDSFGNLFIADTRNNRIRMVAGSGSAVCTLLCSASAPASASVGKEVLFSATASAQGCTGVLSYDWSFGDGSKSSLQNPTYTYPRPGSFTWNMTVSVGAVMCSRSGSIAVSEEGGANRVRVRALDEARAPRNVIAFPGQTLYWHYAVETEAGAPVSAAKVSCSLSPVGFNPSPGALACQMEEPGHLVVKAEVDGMNLPPPSSGASFSFQLGANSLTLDGERAELTQAPPEVSLSLSAPPLIDAWDVFGELSAGATGCLSVCGQVGAVPLSVAAARLSGALSGGAGLRLEQDLRQLHRAGRGISLNRRFALTLGARLKTPSLMFQIAPAADASLPLGASAGGSYGFTGSQTVSYGGDSEKEAKLVHAAFTLESLSLAGVPLPPAAGVVLLATVESLRNLGRPANLVLESQKEYTAGTTLEGRLSANVGYPALWEEPFPQIVLGGTMTGVLEQQAGAELGPESSVRNYVGRIRWAGAVEGETFGDFADPGRFGLAAASLLSGARAFEYGHEWRLSPSSALTSFETFFGATKTQNLLNLAAYTGQSLKTTTLRYRYGQACAAAAMRAALPPESYTVGTLRQTAEQVAQVRKAAQDATQDVAYEVASEITSARKVTSEVDISLSIPSAARDFDLGFNLAMLRERKVAEASRSVAVQGREWKMADYSGQADDTQMPALAEWLRDEVFAGLGPWIEEAWQGRVTSLSAVAPQTGGAFLEVRDRVTRKLVANLSAPSEYAGKTLRVWSYSADRPEATGFGAQGLVTAAQWRYTTTRIAGQAAPTTRLVVVGNVVEVSVHSEGGAALEAFQPPLRAEFPLDPARLARYGVEQKDRARIGIYRYDARTREWSAVASSPLAGGQTWEARLTQPGVYAPGLEVTAAVDDSDRDGLPTSQEDLDGNGLLGESETHPYVWDTDGDGVSDGEERRQGTDPTSATSHPNRAPALGFIGNRRVRVGATLEIQLVAYDDDGQALRFSASALPAGAELDAASGWFRWTPVAAGEHAVEFRVSDGSLEDAESVLLTAYLEAPAVALGVPRTSVRKGDLSAASRAGYPARLRGR